MRAVGSCALSGSIDALRKKRMSPINIKFTPQNSPITRSFRTVFYVSKIIGYLPYEFEAYRSRRELRSSRWASAIVAIVMITMTIIIILAITYVAINNGKGPEDKVKSGKL